MTHLHPRRAKKFLKEKICKPIIANYLNGNNYLTPQTVALVTGGASGLGLAIVNELLTKGIDKVIIIDVVPPKPRLMENSRVIYYHCDISIYEEVVNLRAKVNSECGTVSLIINNAGITSIGTLVETPEERIEQIFKVNFSGSYHIMNLFLPDLAKKNGGYLVNVVSVLGEVTPARLIAYGSSKGALIGFHDRLSDKYRNSAELDLSKIRMLLVCPGKLETTMFGEVRTPSSVLAPDVKVDRLAFLIVRAIQNGETGFLRQPYYTNIIPLLDYLDWPYIHLFKKVSGMNKATNVRPGTNVIVKSRRY